MTTKEFAILVGAKPQTVQKWAAKNKLERKIGVGGIAAYEFTEADTVKFANRPKVGRKHKTE
ncbi:MAG: hypothetical protein Ta2A_09140 [Treponemataceae bacterium]|nr:MAG: hypothetical protein Ta2A_09140 [Treponemataceae bacterium]